MKGHCSIEMLGYIKFVNNTSTWPEYLSEITQGDSGTRIAQLSGVPESTVSRWRSGIYSPKPSHVVAVARAYGVNVAEALIASNFIDAADVDLNVASARKFALREYTDMELAQEMVRRVAEGGSVVLEEPLDEDHPAMRAPRPERPDLTRRARKIVTDDEDENPEEVAKTLKALMSKRAGK